MRIGIPKEQLINETRVAATPKTAQQLLNLGFTVAIEHDAGKFAHFSNEEFTQAGAKIVSKVEVWQSPIILKVNAPEENEIALLNAGAILISFIYPEQNPGLLEKLAAREITVIAMDSVPRISRAQSFDALSSMANIAGYRAIIESAHKFDRFFSGKITAAGKIPPAKVMVIGAGVAGLSAIGTAISLGAIVRAFDIRSEVKEQIQSMGAEFLDLNFKKEEISNYNSCEKVVSNDLIEAEIELFSAQIKEVDIIVTTVLTPGKKALKLITRDMVDAMNPGSVIVDLSAKNGGNCEYTVANEIITTDSKVKIIGYTDLSRHLPTQSSQLYSTNLVNFLNTLCKERDGNIVIDFKDIVVRSMTIIYKGEITWPPPKIQLSAQSEKEVKEQITIKEEKKNTSSWFKYAITTLMVILFFWLATLSSEEFLNHFVVLVLSCIVGYYVIWDVPHALHAPLMSVTNAISGIIIIGSILQIQHGGWVSFLSFVSILIASINIFGGFSVTQRMLKIFRKR